MRLAIIRYGIGISLTLLSAVIFAPAAAAQLPAPSGCTTPPPPYNAAKVTFWGCVLTASGAPQAGATVTAAGSTMNATTTTDAQGNWYISIDRPYPGAPVMFFAAWNGKQCGPGHGSLTSWPNDAPIGSRCS